MPERQYFYTPILLEQVNIGEKNAEGVYIASDSCSPGADNPDDPGVMISVEAEGLMCLRVDEDNNRCVVSMPQHLNTIGILKPTGVPGILEHEVVDLVQLADWNSVDRIQLESEYANPEVNAPDSERIIDFTVEEGD